MVFRKNVQLLILIFQSWLARNDEEECEFIESTDGEDVSKVLKDVVMNIILWVEVSLSKFHCELNYIEMIWTYAKTYLRRRCVFKFAGFEDLLPNVLLSIRIAYFKRVARHCSRFMDGYRKSLTGSLLKFAVKKYRGHRMIPAESMPLITEQYQKSMSK